MIINDIVIDPDHHINQGVEVGQNHLKDQEVVEGGIDRDLLNPHHTEGTDHLIDQRDTQTLVTGLDIEIILAQVNQIFPPSQNQVIFIMAV